MYQQRPSASPAARTLAVSVLFFAFFWLYARSHFLRDPGSIFYDPQHAFDRFYSDIRVSEAESLLRRPLDVPLLREHVASSRKHAAGEPCLCATITTVKRDTTQPYIYSTIGSLLVNLTLAERASLQLNVFFADLDPEQNTAFHNERLAGLVDHVHTYRSLGKSQQEQEAMAHMISDGRMMDKSTNDYVTALNVCLERSTCPYIAVIEGDVIFADSWLARTHVSLASLAADPLSWLDLRLFNQERSTGWRSKKVGGNSELPISIAVSAALCATVLVLWRVRPATRHSFTPGVLAVLCLFTVPTAIVLFYLSGKASLLPPQPGVQSEFFGCCSQALVFNRQHISGLISLLRDRIGGPQQYDMVTRDYAWLNGLKRLAQYPVMVQHIGTQSANLAMSSNSSLVWSMAFEGLQKHTLASSHARLVAKLWGADATTGPYYETVPMT